MLKTYNANEYYDNNGDVTTPQIDTFSEVTIGITIFFIIFCFGCAIL